MNEIYYCCPTQDRAHYLKRNFERILPYVDKAIIIDGGSKDNTKELCESLSPKVKHVLCQWTDDYSASWNAFLEHVPVGDFVLVQDDDELPSLELCQNLKKIVDESDNGKNYSVVEFRCRPVSIGMDNREVDLGVSNYYRQIFYLRGPETRYQGKNHQYVVGYVESPGNPKRSQLEYSHIKHVKDEIRGSCRNYIVGGIFLSWCKDIGIFGVDYDELMDILGQCHPDVKVFNNLADHIINGTVNEKVLAWIVYYYHQYKNGCPPGGCYLCYYVPLEEREHHDYFNEIRAFYRYVYEIVHPEWKPLSFEEAKKILGKA